MASALVVHCKRSSYDVYIGRGPDPRTGKWNVWGNPFKIGPDGTREEVIAKFRCWFYTRPDLVAKAKRELKGKVLGCWCSPQACHGDVLAEAANGPGNS